MRGGLGGRGVSRCVAVSHMQRNELKCAARHICDGPVAEPRALNLETSMCRAAHCDWCSSPNPKSCSLTWAWVQNGCRIAGLLAEGGGGHGVGGMRGT